MEIHISAGDAATDISRLVTAVNWSGDIAQCGRTLSFGVASSPIDPNIPAVDIPLGAAALMSDGGGTLFEGYVFTRQKLTGSSVMEITCFDRGIYLKRNKTTRKYSGALPEEMAADLCGEFGIEPGRVAATGVRVSRNFVGATLHQIIQTAYTLAAKETGEAYQIRFNGAALDVVRKAVTEETLVIRGGSNLMDAAVTESIERMVSQVAIYDDGDRPVGTVRDEGRIRLYGVMQEAIRQQKDKDAWEQAAKLLEDGGESQKITVDNLGDVRCITGDAVVVEEPYTGLNGLFWIDSDAHAWKNGLHLSKLTLNFRRMMDEQEAGSLPEAGGGAGGRPAARPDAPSDMWEYVY